KALKAEKVGTLTAYAALSDADRAALLEKLGKADKAASEDWLGQAKEMIAGEPPRAKVDQAYAARLLAKRAKDGK
ncbi:MAG: 50S ribosomal protein L4, partial [Pseudomonadota bacterium]